MATTSLEGYGTTPTIDEILSRHGLRREHVNRECVQSIRYEISIKIVNWKMVGRLLGIPEEKLAAIQRENNSEDERRFIMLYTWYQAQGSQATYLSLMKALHQHYRRDLIECLCGLINKFYSRGPVNTQPESIGSGITVEIKIKRLERRFFTLHDQLKSELLQKNITVEAIAESLTLLPMKIKLEYDELVQAKLPQIETATTITQLINRLNPLFTFIDYNLLDHLASQFGSAQLQANMILYIQDVQVFMHETTVGDVMPHWPGRKISSDEFFELWVKIKANPEECRLRELQDIRDKVCATIKLSAVLSGIKSLIPTNSFFIVLLIPIATTVEVAKAIDFYREEQVCMVVLDNKLIYLSDSTDQINRESTVMGDHYLRFDVSTEINLTSGTLGKGRAIPLCLPNDTKWDQQRNKCKRLEDVKRTKLVLNSQALDILRSISGPVCVIAIVGPCRSGKSYILGRLISSTGEWCPFDLGHEMDPKTMGIWMWDQPFKMKLNNFKEEATVILLDTEGIDAANATDQGDSQIFTLSVLLSSLMIYNSMSVPRREDLNQMHFVANLSKSIQVQAGKSAEGKEGVKMVESNPRFMWLLRDVVLIPTDRSGKPCHIKDYLLQKVLVEYTTDDATQKEIRQCILSFFNGFDAETLPPPSTDPHVMQNIENPLYQKEISLAFLQKIEYVRKRIFDNCAPKKGFTGGSIINGFQLAHMIELYVDALNSPGGIPVIGFTWQRVVEATYMDGMESAIKLYREVMERAIQLLPMEDERLLTNHRKGVEEAMKRFNQATSVDSDSEIYQSYLDQLMAKIAVFDDNGECTDGQLVPYLKKNYEKSKSACQTLILSLKEKHLDPLIKTLTPETDFKTIEAAFMTLISEYSEKCVLMGPAAEYVLNVFIQEQEKEREQLETMLKTLKNYDDQAKQRMKELKERMEQKEIEMMQRMEQSKKDQEAKLKAMNDKYTKIVEKLRQENLKQLEEQEKRLRNMAEANLKKAKDEHSQQMNQLRATLEQKERELKQHNDHIAAETRWKQEEAERLRKQQEAARRRKKMIKGCFVQGTKVTCSSGNNFNIEKQTGGVKILALGGETTIVTEEFVQEVLSEGEQFFGFNGDQPFAALHHPFWTAEGWKCLDPETAKEENPDVDFKLLQVGDIVFRIAQTDPLLYKPIKIYKFTFQTLQEPTKIYGLHLDGSRSYHANGYAVMANYPVLTKKRVRKGMSKLSDAEKARLQSSLTSVKGELTKVLGSWANDAFDDIGLTVKTINE